MNVHSLAGYWLSAILLFFSLHSTALTGEDGYVPKTVTEAKALRDKLFEEMKGWAKFPPPDAQMQRPLFLLRFLDSENPAIRAVAVGAFAKITLIRLDECIPYLDPKRPLQERMPLLILCISQLGGLGEDSSAKGIRQKIIVIANEILDNEICPPQFMDLARTLAYGNYFWGTSGKIRGISINNIVKESARELVARRFLATISATYKFSSGNSGVAKSKDKSLPKKVFELVLSLGAKNAGTAIRDWYRTEPDAKARSIVVDPSLSWSKIPEWGARRKAILELAAKDWDEEIAKKAKALLAATNK